ncbi:MAG: sortase [Chloroflexi bacterium]|nr:sortase [Chloroflexota bacterium]
METQRQFRRTVALGVVIAGTGLLCLGGALALLTWRLLHPEEAVRLLPGIMLTPEDTPTPGLLGSPLPLPPRPESLAQVGILPVSDLPTATPTGQPSPARSAVPTRTPRASAAPPQPSTTPARDPAAPVTPTATPGPLIPQRLVINRIGLDAPIVPVNLLPVEINGVVYSQWDVPDTFAAGWHHTSAPLGQPGNTVINGHHNVYGEVFRYLVELQPGDVIGVDDAHGTRHFYTVAQTMTLAEQGQPLETRLENAQWILPTGDERLTLVTCWPYTANTHRLLVIALPVPLPGEEQAENSNP